MDNQSPASCENLIDQLRSQLSASQNHVAQLQQEKHHMSVDFEYKESKMKELYFSKENAVREQNVKLFEAGRQISMMESTILKLREEIENVKMIASVSENTKEEAVQELKKHHQEEIESLRCVLQDSMEEQRRELVVQFEQERRHWEEEKGKLEQERSEAKELLSEERSLAMVRLEEKNAQRKQDSELSMKKAQIETETLKAVVVPLETEIAELKAKLKKATMLVEGERSILGQDDTNKVSSQMKDLPNGVSGATIDAVNSQVSAGLPDDPSSDEESFTNFQSYTSENPQSTCNESATITEFPDTISISSVSSLPSSTGLAVPGDLTKAHRVFSAPHLRQLGVDRSPDKHAEPKVWMEVPANTTESKESLHVDIMCSVCTKSLTNLEKLQTENASLQKQTIELNKVLEKEKHLRTQVEESVAYASEEAQKQIQDLAKKLSYLEHRMEEDKSWRKKKETEDDKRLSILQKECENMNIEFNQTKKENERVRALYERHRVDLNKESVLPSSIEGLSFQVRKYREALLAARVEKGHIEKRLQSQLGFLQDRFKAEQIAKEQLESTLLSELEQLKKELASLQDVKMKLDKETASKIDLLAKAEKDQISFDTIRAKSKEIIKGLKDKLTRETNLKEELENKLSTAKNQVRSLQDALETSEHVQQDFVRLSQSLQMKLEEIRQREEGGSHHSANPADRQSPNRSPR